MNNFTPAPQQLAATVTPPAVEQQTVAAVLEAGHSQGACSDGYFCVSCANVAAPPSTAGPLFSFDDEPLFEADGSGVPLPPDDFFSSPEWTDPSPALTMAMSFAVDSCDTSPLLTADNYDVPDLSGVPLFGGDYYSARSPQNAFNTTKDVNEESGLLLLRALNKHNAASGLNTADESVKLESSTVPLTASPSAISSPMPFVNRPSLSTSSSSESFTDRQPSSSRGIKRRHDTTDLLPMDAPIQPRTYKTPSATSRKEIADEGAAIAAEKKAIDAIKNPLEAKRLSNTLAARRSRHRKAAELQDLHDTIEELRSEKDFWKKKFLKLEQQLGL